MRAGEACCKWTEQTVTGLTGAPSHLWAPPFLRAHNLPRNPHIHQVLFGRMDECRKRQGWSTGTKGRAQPQHREVVCVEMKPKKSSGSGLRDMCGALSVMLLCYPLCFKRSEFTDSFALVIWLVGSLVVFLNVSLLHSTLWW